MTLLIYLCLLIYADFVQTVRITRTLTSSSMTTTTIKPDESNIIFTLQNETSVNALVQFDDQFLAVAGKNSISIFEFADPKKLTLRQLSKLDFKESFRDLLELKFISSRQILFCTFVICKICEIQSKECIEYSLESINANGLVSLQAVVISPNRLIVRGIGQGGVSASIYAFTSGMAPHFMTDHSSIKNHRVVASFQDESYTYFLGSATKNDIPFSMTDNENNQRQRTDLRLSRICNFDGTKNLESRIDIALSCDPQKDNYFTSLPQQAQAATLDADGKFLFVAFENETASTSSKKTLAICKFNFLNVKKAFDKTWQDCQGIKDGKNELMKCQEENALSSNCFLFSWQMAKRHPICERFNKDESNLYSNCELNTSLIMSDRNGWIENFKPFKGELYSKFNSDSDILSIFENNNNDALFVAFENGRIGRVHKDKIFYPKISASTPILMELNRARQALIYVDNLEIKYSKIDCSNLYPECENIEWQDPLSCVWCSDLNGLTGHTLSRKHSNNVCKSGQLIHDICPPKILEINFEKGKYTIIGENFDRIQNLTILGCSMEECNVLHKTNTVILCGTLAKTSCPIQLAGILGDLNNYTIQYSAHMTNDETELPTEANQEANKHSRITRIFVSILIMIILLSVLIILWQLYRKYAVRIKNKVKQNSEKNFHKYKSVISEPHFGDDCDYGNGFEDGTFGELDRSRIYIVKHIGDGYSSKVHLAKYKLGTQDSRSVAVKTVNNTSFDQADVLREIELISKCSHKNIVEYIGHYRDLYGMHIVTEYMAGGDLHEYLINENNKPIIGHAFLYILQICEAMEYLTKKHIVHRDLAARNCMLDEEHLIVKITDFGLCRTSNVDYEYISENHFQQLPFRWTAIECFGNNSKFSEKSDVWSFGVVVWEIFARNMQPYEGFDSRGVREFLSRGTRLQPIAFCPDELYHKVMLRCWDEQPCRRPTFTQLRGEIEHIFWSMETKFPEYLTTEYETPIKNNQEYIDTTKALDSDEEPKQITTIM